MKSAIWKTILNILSSFAVGYGTAVASGQPTKTAVIAGAVAAATNQAALHQTAPKDAPQ